MTELRPADEIEVHCLLKALRLRHGYDFREYSPASVQRRIQVAVATGRYDSVGHLQDRLLHDPDVVQWLLGILLVHTTEMFRDPEFYRALREHVLPRLASWPFIRIWHAGCSTGEEVWSVAILLHEAGLLSRARIYATDLDPAALQTAQSGIFAAERVPEYTKAYQQAGGRAPFSDYYRARDGKATLSPELLDGVVFHRHNLVCDRVFQEMNLIVCRNVLIYMQRPLQDRVLGLFADSLVRGGILALGTKETVEFTESGRRFHPVDKRLKIFRGVTS